MQQVVGESRDQRDKKESGLTGSRYRRHFIKDAL
jgi:hypothetical protein